MRAGTTGVFCCFGIDFCGFSAFSSLLQHGDAKGICLECVERLRIAYNFRETVLLSQQMLQEDDNKIKSSLEEGSVQDESNSESICGESSDVVIKQEESEILGDNSNSDVLEKLCKELQIDIKKQLKNHSDELITQECTLCNEKFDNKRKLRQHLKQDHKQQHVCQYCNREFKQASHLREHVTAHTGEKLYCCNLCGKTFQRMSSRSRHLKAHERAPGQKTKRTPFLCTICGKRFPFSNSVQRHMRMHMGIKLHECNICQKRFNQTTHLRVHMRTHTGEKPYICDLCGGAFSLNASLQKHMSTHNRPKDKKRSSHAPEYIIPEIDYDT